MGEVAEGARPARVSAGFIAGLSLAHVGAAFGFAPLLGILLPLATAQIDPAHKSLLLSRMLFWGAITAGVANVLFGALSDVTRSPLGRRRPWILAGLAGSLAAYVVIAQARGAAGLLVGLVVFQFAFNAIYAPLAAIFADRVPDAQKGLVAGFVALGYPLGAGTGAWVVGRLLETDGARLTAIAAVLTLTVGAFALGVREAPAASRSAPAEPRPTEVARNYRDFALAWTARFLVQTAFFIPTAYGLFYVQDVLGYGRLFPGARAEAGYAVLVLVSTCANLAACLSFGWWSDLAGRRKPLICVAALVLGAGLLAAARGLDWQAALLVWAAAGAGLGGFIAVESALVAQLLPSARRSGRDLGLMNLGNTLPQSVGPVLGGLLLSGPHPDYRVIFAIAGGLAWAGCLCVLPIRAVR